MRFTKIIAVEVIEGSFAISRRLTPGEREEVGAATQSLPEGKYDVCFYDTDDREDRGYTVFRSGLLDHDCVCPRRAPSAAFCDCID